VSTVARTAFRIPKRTVEGTCPLCYGPKDDIDDFTKLMQKVDDEPKTIVSGVEEGQLVEEACTKAECCGGDACASKAKDINALPLLCYACRNIYKAKIELPQFAVTNAKRQLNSEEMRESIQSFIIED
jgi:hypothetical protein